MVSLLRSLIGLVLIYFVFTKGLYAQDDPVLPPGAEADVIDAKIRDEAQTKLLTTRAEAPVEVEEKDRKKPAEEGPTFVLKAVALHDESNMIPADKMQPILEQFIGEPTSFKKLQTMSGFLEQTYRQEGYFAVVYLPPQKIQEGRVRLNAFASRMGTVDVEGNRWFRKKKTRSYWTIPVGEVIKFDEIQRSLQRMNENPDRTVRPILKAGEDPKTTDVTLKVEDRFPVHVGYSFDNQGVQLTGKKRNGFTVRHNNALSLDDTLLVGTSFGEEFGAVFYQHMLPLGNKGTKLVTSFSHAQVTPHKEFDRFGINGISQSYGVAIRQDVVKTPRINLNANVGFDFKEKKTHILSETTNWDRLRVLKWGTDTQIRDSNGIWVVGQNFAKGFPLHGDGFALNSREGETNFFKYNFSIARHQKMPLKTRAMVSFEGQWTPNRLMPQEQMFLGGTNSVRGYPESDYGSDRATQTKIEYWVPFFFIPEKVKLPYEKGPLKDQLQFVFFLDHARGSINNAQVNERKSRNYLGAGGGVSVRLYKNVSVRVEWAAPLHDDPLTQSAESQFHFRIAADV